MGKGGVRSNAGRPVGARNKLTKEAVEKARATGELPHEFLLRVSRGETIDGHTPDFEERVHAAEACAGYFAPKLSSVEQKTEVELPSVFSDKPLTADEWNEKFGKR